MSYSIIIPSRNPTNLGMLTASIWCVDRESESKVIAVLDGPGKGMQIEGLRSIQGIEPFVFARNINLGINAAGRDDVILLNDDTRLLSDMGFSWLAATARENPQYGIISAGITGAVGNLEQIAQAGTRLREAKHHTIVFVAVYIRREVIDAVGLLDERYVDYGYDDDDYCERVRQAGLKLGVFDGCVVEHGVLPSSYRSGGYAPLEPNATRFLEKWGFRPGRNPAYLAARAPKKDPAVKW